MTSRPCPDLPAFEDLLRDTLPAAEQEFLAEHLERCGSCRSRLEGLATPTKSILPDRGPSTFGGFGNDPPPRELIERWQGQVPPTPVPLASDNTGEILLQLLEPAEDPDELGRLGPYHILRVIGQGGMGIVLLARDSALRRQVALKLMQPALAVHPEARERFLREARAAAAVHDDHVVTIHAVESGRSVPYLVMEYVPGRSLQEILNAGERLPMAEVAALGAQVAEGLAAAHACGLVHRDVKPANILIDRRTGRAKLTDFGLARAGDDPVLTRPGIVTGTPEYMAPEQASGKVVDHRADLYSLGAVLYAVLTGRPPLTASFTQDLLQKLSNEAPPPLRRSDPDTPTALVELIGRLLRKEPASRPESAESVARTLRGLVGPSAPSSRSPTRRRSVAAIGLAGLLALGAWLGRGPGDSAMRRIPGPDPAAIPPGPSGPFSLGGGRRFDTLAAAIAQAPTSHATIEIDGDGPYITGPIRIKGKPLTLRAGRGRRPVLRFVPDNEAVPSPGLETDSPLTLEGLEVHSTVRGGTSVGDDISRFSAIAVRDGPFRAAHCQFVVGPRNACLSLRDSTGEVQACQFSATGGIALHWVPGPDRTLVLRQNLLLAHAALVVDIGRLGAGAGKVALRIDRTTVRAYAALEILRECDRRRHSIADATRPDLTIESGTSVFDATHILALVDCSPLRRPRGIPPVESIAPGIKSRIAWRGHDNLYPPAPNWLSFGSRNRKITPFPDGPADLAAWEQFWDGTETGSIESKLSFRGPSTGANPADHALVPSGDEADPRRLVPRGVDADRCGPRAANAASRHLDRKSGSLSD
jgi:serine/threonine protein kinase